MLKRLVDCFEAVDNPRESLCEKSVFHLWKLR